MVPVLTLVGISHVFDLSRQVREVILARQPGVVGLELDRHPLGLPALAHDRGDLDRTVLAHGDGAHAAARAALHSALEHDGVRARYPAGEHAMWDLSAILADED